MMNTKFGSLVIIIVVVSCLAQSQDIHAIIYSVTNTVPNSPGGKVFDEFVGVEFSLQLLPSLADFIHAVFKQKTAADGRNVSAVDVYITESSLTQTQGSQSQINISASAIPRQNSKWFFKSVMVREMARVLQSRGDGEGVGVAAPVNLTDGIAEYVRLKSGYYDPATFAKPGDGYRWDQGSDVTARFLEYCDSLVEGFTAILNKMMRDRYQSVYWRYLLGKYVDQIWADYKAKYHKTN